MSNQPIKNQQQNQPTQQPFVFRDDIIQFSHHLVSAARNRYRKKNCNFTSHNVRKKIQQSSHNPTTTQITSHNSQQQIQTHKKFQGKQQEDGILFPQRRSVDIPGFKQRKKNVFTTHGQKRYAASSQQQRDEYHVKSVQLSRRNKISPGSHVSFEIKKPAQIDEKNGSQQDNDSIMEGIGCQQKGKTEQVRNNQIKSQFLERKYNKGGKIKDSGVQSWLNQALIEASPHLEIDKNVENGGIKFYKIDKSSLISKGIHPNHISRLYRSLFVYSIGFNNLLKQVCKGSAQLQKSIWKVYAVLLQYCSVGDFQTMIGQIQRDKVLKLNEMKIEIKKRQRLIQESDEIHEEKHRKILKQLRQVQELSKNLSEQKQIILQDFHEAEQSFNEEIWLRLKYQNRINQIYGVFEELRQKHSSLKQQFDAAVKTVHLQQNDLIEVKKVLVETQIELDQKIKDYNHLEKERAILEKLIQETEKKVRRMNSQIMSSKSGSDHVTAIIDQKQKIIVQLKLELQNTKGSERALMLTYTNKSQQYSRSLKENSSLHQKIKQQTSQISDLMLQIRQKGFEGAQAHASYLLQVKKNEEKYQKIVQLKKQLMAVQEKLRISYIDLDSQKQLVDCLKGDLEKCMENIKEMKDKNNEVTGMLDDAKKQIEFQQEVIRQKMDRQLRIGFEIQKFKQKISELQTDVKLKDSKIFILNQKLNSEVELLQKKLDNALEINLKINEKCDRYESERDGLFKTIAENQQKYQKMFHDYRNQQFERRNLDLRYQQSLTVLQEQNHHIKSLNIQISLLKDKASDLQRKIQNQKFLFQEKQAILTKDLQFWKVKFVQIEKQVKGKKMHINPMIFQDIYAQYLRNNDKNNKLVKENRQLVKRVNQLQIQKVRVEQNAKIEKRKIQQSKQGYLKQQLACKTKQFDFLKQKLEYQNKKLKEIQAKMQRMDAERYAAQEEYMVKQTQIMEKMSERNIELKQANQKYLQKHAEYEKQYEDMVKLIQKNEILEKQLKILSQTKDKENGRRSIYDNAGSNKKVKKGDQNIENKESSIREDEEGQYMSPKKESSLSHAQSKFLDQGSESPKKREDIRKKMKGAFLYYHK